MNHGRLRSQSSQRNRHVHCRIGAWNERTPVLVAKAIQASEGELTAHGALAVTTGVYTGRSVKDKFIVEDDLTRDHVWWQNSLAMSGENFDRLLADVVTAMAGRHIFTARTSWPAPIRATPCRSPCSPRPPGTRCSSATC
jgi:ATP-dependent phosphoenolpyruvate carboxykinase